jgi:hypothetical protein
VGAESQEVILPLPPAFGPLKGIRSTLLISSYAAVRESGRGDAYLAVLAQSYRKTIVEAVAGTWIPIEVAVAHYDACNSVGFTTEEQVKIGRQIGERMHGTLLGTVVRMAKEAGVTPWTVIPQFQRFWNRAYDGGGIYAVKVGPKEVLISVQKAVIADCAYWRSALCGTTMGVLDLFCRKSYMTERTAKGRVSGSATFRIQWV